MIPSCFAQNIAPSQSTILLRKAVPIVSIALVVNLDRAAAVLRTVSRKSRSPAVSAADLPRTASSGIKVTLILPTLWSRLALLAGTGGP